MINNKVNMSTHFFIEPSTQYYNTQGLTAFEFFFVLKFFCDICVFIFVYIYICVYL